MTANTLQYEALNGIHISVSTNGSGKIINQQNFRVLEFEVPHYKDEHVCSCITKKENAAIYSVLLEIEAKSIFVQRQMKIYIDSGVVEVIDTIRNTTDESLDINLPTLLDVKCHKTSNSRLEMLTGGGNFTGSHILRDETPEINSTNHYWSNEKPKVIRVDGVKRSKRKFVEGTSVWQEFFCVRDENAGFHITFDYAGIWTAKTQNTNDSFLITVDFPSEPFTIPANEHLRLPPIRLGAYSGDLDAMGNSILDFCYEHKWDYTNPEYFGKINAFMFWINDKHTSMPQCENAFWIVRNAQTLGAEIVHVDDFWYDKKGDWNNISTDDFNKLNAYATKCGLKLSIWYAPWHADHDSEPFRKHRNWRIKNDKKQWYGGHFNMANSEACKWQLSLMKRKQLEWGTHMIKYDGEPIWPSGKSWKDMPKSSDNWYQLLRDFRTQCPDAGVFGCASGGELMGIEALRYSDLHCVTDESVMHMNGYYNTLITPPDKVMSGGKNKWGYPYDPTTRGAWKTEVQINMNEAAKSMNEDDIELLRRDVERYRYFHTKGCAGRWSRVYRPLCKGFDPTLVLQKMSPNQLCGYITIDTTLTPRNKPVIIYPRGLIADKQYTFAAIENSFDSVCKFGWEWMKKGLHIEKINVGEMICINLHDIPGMHKTELFVPAPNHCEMTVDEIMGHKGVSISWKLPQIEQWYSYAAIYCEHERVAIASVGEYCFLPNADSNANYSVQLFDGYGNSSERVTCIGV